MDTRWNSKFYMTERFLLLRPYVTNILINERSAPDMVNGYGYVVNILLELRSMLRPLESVTRELSADKFVTISKIIPLINCPKLQIEKLCDEN
jgi:hypothetical protein